MSWSSLPSHKPRPRSDGSTPRRRTTEAFCDASGCSPDGPRAQTSGPTKLVAASTISAGTPGSLTSSRMRLRVVPPARGATPQNNNVKDATRAPCDSALSVAEARAPDRECAGGGRLVLLQHSAPLRRLALVRSTRGAGCYREIGRSRRRSSRCGKPLSSRRRRSSS